MESRFSFLYQRDSSVSMLRVKMSRWRSQTQKENRDRAVRQRRRLNKLPEMEASGLEESAIEQPVCVEQRAVPVQKQAKNPNTAVEERKRMLARYREAKELQKEKEKREKEKKGAGVFKVGLYKPQPLGLLAQIPPVLGKDKLPVAAQSSRLTRSMKRQQAQKVGQATTQTISEPKKELVRASKSQTVSKLQTASALSRGRMAVVESIRAPVVTSKATRKTTSVQVIIKGPKTTAAYKQLAVAPKDSSTSPKGKGETNVQTTNQKPTDPAERETKPIFASAFAAGQMMEATVPGATPSFAPEGFIFQAPLGLKSFQPVPLSPHSADAFITPSASEASVLFSSPVTPGPSAVPTASPSVLSPPSEQEPQRDIPYFRAVMASETDRLTGLCEHWDPRIDDPSIPEEMQDNMRTAVGQARLLIKERFGQFKGLVDNCALGRGEKVTTCCDLQGFWDMVYNQVEDVTRKFNALKEAETRGWKDEPQPQLRAKKNIRKLPPASVKLCVAEGGATAAARSRLATVKAAMKVKQVVVVDNDNALAGSGSPHHPIGTVVFHGGFFKVESPAKIPGTSGSCVGHDRYPEIPLVQLEPVMETQYYQHAVVDGGQIQKLADKAQACNLLEMNHSFDEQSRTTLDRLSLSPCLIVDSSCVKGDGLSFTLSPSPSTEDAMTQNGLFGPRDASPVPSPPGSSSAPLVYSVGSNAVSTDVDLYTTPDTSFVENIPGLDFERYLRPTLRGSLSPRETVAMEALPPMASDTCMERPVTQQQEQPEGRALAHRGLLLGQMFIQHTEKPVGTGLLLFTPEQRDKIRHSVCERDLMMFTPPSSH